MTNRFMRLLVFFDLPMVTNEEKRIYRHFSKYLTSEGYVRIQYSLYSKLCINVDSAKTYSKRLKQNSPNKGDIRYLIITEKQYQGIINLNNKHSLQEKITNMKKMYMIGGMNDEDNKGQ